MEALSKPKKPKKTFIKACECKQGPSLREKNGLIFLNCPCGKTSEKRKVLKEAIDCWNKGEYETWFLF